MSVRKTKPDVEVGGGQTISFEDATLVERTRSGDMQAFGALVAKYQDRVFNMVYRMCGRREDAEELSQEAFLKALEKITQFRSQSSFYTWLFRIAANLVISHRRRSGRITFHTLDPSDGDGESQAGALTAQMAARREKSPVATVVSAEAQLMVTAALEELDDEMRLVVLLRDGEDMEYTEIADVLNTPVGTVKSRLHRARTELREKLKDLVS